MATDTIEKKPTLFTPFNIITGAILLVGGVITVIRFTQGLGAVTNLDNNHPWGIWISFDLLCGVALAAGGYTTSAAVYLFGMKKWHAAVRPALLTAFLGYALVVVALLYDVGRPWRLPYPFLSPGTTSVLLEVGFCVGTYLTVLFLEFVPAPLEWLGIKKIRTLLIKITLVLTIFGVVLSTLHQSSLGALYLAAPHKMHPLWYSPFIPVFFFVSSIVAGLSMVMFEGNLSHRYFHHKMSDDLKNIHDDFTFGFAKAASMVLAGYFTIKIIGVAMENAWGYIWSGYGAWWLVEMLGFVLLPCILYAIGTRERNRTLIKIAAPIAVLGIIVNRFNISLVGFNQHLGPEDASYFPHWMEIGVSVFVVTVGVVLFKFIVTRMPIFYEHPDYQEEHH